MSHFAKLERGALRFTSLVKGNFENEQLYLQSKFVIGRALLTAFIKEPSISPPESVEEEEEAAGSSGTAPDAAVAPERCVRVTTDYLTPKANRYSLAPRRPL